MTKISKSELKSPDEIWKASKSTLEWLTSHAGIAVTSLLVILGVALGGTYWKLHSESREKEAQYYLAKAEKALDQWLASPERGTAVAEKAKFEGEFTTELNTLKERFPNSHTRKLAKGLEARAEVERKNYAAAIPLWKDYIAALPEGERDFGRLSLATSLENTKDWSAALLEYEAILKNKDSALRSWAMLGKARALRNLEKTSEARKVYEDFLKDFPDSTEASKVRGLLALTATAN